MNTAPAIRPEICECRGRVIFYFEIPFKKYLISSYYKVLLFRTLGADVSHPSRNIAQIVQEMTAEECEVFDLLLLGYDPSDRGELEVFLSRVTSPLSQLLLTMIDKDLIRRVESPKRTYLSVNPAAAWFLTPPEERRIQED